jgi:hypothetical protein
MWMWIVRAEREMHSLVFGHSRLHKVRHLRLMNGLRLTPSECEAKRRHASLYKILESH